MRDGCLASVHAQASGSSAVGVLHVPSANLKASIARQQWCLHKQVTLLVVQAPLLDGAGLLL